MKSLLFTTFKMPFIFLRIADDTWMQQQQWTTCLSIKSLIFIPMHLRFLIWNPSGHDWTTRMERYRTKKSRMQLSVTDIITNITDTHTVRRYFSVVTGTFKDWFDHTDFSFFLTRGKTLHSQPSFPQIVLHHNSKWAHGCLENSISYVWGNIIWHGAK